MDINDFYKEFDRLDYSEKEAYALRVMQEASWENKVMILNELVGFFRDTTQFEKGTDACKELVEVLDANNQSGTMNYATSLLNIGNFYRAAKDFELSKAAYNVTVAIYEVLLKSGDYRYAGLYNNMSLLYQDMEDWEESLKYLEKALAVVKRLPDRKVEEAVTYGNMAASYVRLGRMADARDSLQKALDIFEDGRTTDYHYSGTCSAMGDLLFEEGNYKKAADYYLKSAELVKTIFGPNENYELMMDKYNNALVKAGHDSDSQDVNESHPGKSEENVNISGLDLCERYYNEIGAPAIHENFPEWEDKIAIGLVGEGSDCFGMDDEYSRDHDWGPGFCMWVTDETFAVIGPKLQELYDNLPKEFMGYKRVVTPEGRNRIGLKTIDDFYGVYSEDAPEELLATVTNGRIFRDDEGIFTAKRNELLGYYSYRKWQNKLAMSLIAMGVTGQYNLKRSLSRGDRATAIIYLGKYIEHTMKTLFLLNHAYAPYEKWLIKAAGNLPIHPELADIMKALADMDIADEKVTMTIEIVGQIVLSELHNQGQLPEDFDNYYMEKVGRYILDKPADKVSLIDRIVETEWKDFDKTINEGGRADCQDNFNTFSIMRKSQYLEWDEWMIISYLEDFAQAKARGWNLITEKYGRMEKSTAPEKYKEIEAALPPHSEVQDAIIEEIVAIQVGMMERFAADYPKMAGNSRSIHTEEDTEFNTSYETYLRGELGSYSMETLIRYGRFVAGLELAGDNLAYRIMRNTALMYGYKSIDECESKL